MSKLILRVIITIFCVMIAVPAFAAQRAYITEGWYKIVPAHSKNKALDVGGAKTNPGANIQLWDYVGADQQKFYIKHIQNRWYSIKAGNCDLYVDAQGGVPRNGENVHLWSWNGTDAQLWGFYDTGDGFNIETKMQSNLIFDCNGGRGDNGTNVQLWQKGNVAWHRWILIPVEAPATGYFHPLGDKSMKFRGSNNGFTHDYSIAGGTPVYASCDGTAYFYQVVGYYKRQYGLVSYGNYILLKGNNIEFRYGHLQRFNGVNGQVANSQRYGSSYRNVSNQRKILCGQRYVKKGEVIGYVGTTGNSSGNHLHFEVWQNGVRKEPNKIF